MKGPSRGSAFVLMEPRRRFAAALVLACFAGAAGGARAQTQDPQALAEQLINMMLQGQGQQNEPGGDPQLPFQLPGNEPRGSAPGPAPDPGGLPGGHLNTAEPESLPPSRGRAPRAPLPPQTIYRYRDARGHVVYTNSAEQIPELERERAKVDLGHISLNTELGTALNQKLEQRYDKLASSPRCEALRSAAELTFIERMWEDYAPLVVCGCVLLLFLLFTPTAVRQFGGTVWSRTLMMAIPALALAGVATYSLRETGLAIVELKHKAAPCAQDSFARLGAVPDAVMRRAALVRQLQGMVMPSSTALPLDQPLEAQARGKQE